MRTLLIVTHIDFWKRGAGHRARISSLVSYFQDKLNVTVVYAGKFDELDEVILKSYYPGIAFHSLEKNKTVTYKESRLKFEGYIKGKIFDVVLVEYIEMAFVLPFLEGDVMTILDTHDLVSDRIESFRRNDLPYQGIELTSEEEFEIFNCFDHVVVIQESDYEKVVEKMDPDRVILAPHPAHLSKKTLRHYVNSIAFIGSPYSPNVDGITWFIAEVWPSLYEEHKLSLDVYGNICDALSLDLRKNSLGVNFHGFADQLDDVYKKCDVVVNPVRCGAGLKIKNVEALENGLPLVTTTHGASGMDDAYPTPYLVANTAEEFKLAIGKLISDYGFRKNLGENAFRYAAAHFNEEQCYQTLHHRMLGVREPI